jgi:lysine-N-methylase
MGLPVIRVAGAERWDCAACGLCCRGSIVPLSDAEVQMIRDQHWENDPAYAGKTLFVKQSWGSKRYQLAQQPDGCCVFLTAENRCRVHEKFGPEGKPIPCRMFPLQLVPHEQQALLTLRRACPTAALDEGRELRDHLPEVRDFVKRGLLEVPSALAPPIQTSGPRLGDDAERNTQRVLQAVVRIFGDERFPPVRRVVHAILFARYLERAKFKKLTPAQVGEFVDLIEPGVVSEASPLFANRRPPSSLGLMLFRLTLAEYVRLHPGYRVPKGFGVRGKLLMSLLRMMRGQGSLPAMHPEFPALTFAQLTAPLASLDPGYLAPEVQRPLARYLECLAASHQFALANRGQWSIVQSIRGFALTFPIALAMLRWATIGRKPTARDMALIITALDRGQGFAPLSGGRYRTTLGLLEWQGDQERLAIWLAR